MLRSRCGFFLGTQHTTALRERAQCATPSFSRTERLPPRTCFAARSSARRCSSARTVAPTPRAPSCQARRHRGRLRFHHARDARPLRGVTQVRDLDQERTDTEKAIEYASPRAPSTRSRSSARPPATRSRARHVGLLLKYLGRVRLVMERRRSDLSQLGDGHLDMRAGYGMLTSTPEAAAVDAGSTRASSRRRSRSSPDAQLEPAVGIRADIEILRVTPDRDPTQEGTRYRVALEAPISRRDVRTDRRPPITSSHRPSISTAVRHARARDRVAPEVAPRSVISSMAPWASAYSIAFSVSCAPGPSRALGLRREVASVSGVMESKSPRWRRAWHRGARVLAARPRRGTAPSARCARRSRFAAGGVPFARMTAWRIVPGSRNAVVCCVPEKEAATRA